MKYLWIVSIPVALLFFEIVVGFSEVQAQPKLTEEEAARSYVGSSQCKMCHTNTKAYEKARLSFEKDHVKAFQALLGEKAKEIAKEKGLSKPPHESPECMKCHVTGYDVEKATYPRRIKPSDGLQCESCHGPASEHLNDGKALKINPADIATIDIKANISRPTEERCRSCHNSNSPTWDPERYTKTDGSKDGFDFETSYKKIAHDYPENYFEDKYKGNYPKE